MELQEAPFEQWNELIYRYEWKIEATDIWILFAENEEGYPPIYCRKNSGDKEHPVKGEPCIVHNENGCFIISFECRVYKLIELRYNGDYAEAKLKNLFTKGEVFWEGTRYVNA